VRILAVADHEDRALAEHFDPRRWAGIDLIISCGDLDSDYLDYLVSRLNVPLLYVRGNHDSRYAEQPPGGCQNIDGRVVRVSGMRIAGLEGSRWYGGNGVEYTDRAMRWRTRLLRLRLKMSRGVDIIVAHAPPSFPTDGGGDGPPAQVDRVHAGFDAFRDLIQVCHPRLFLHGHTHLGYGRGKRERWIGETRVIDCYGAYVVEIDEGTKRRPDPARI
jgi:Icc-related predicted phosphoesterase